MTQYKLILYFEKEIITDDEDLAHDIGEEIEEQTDLEYTGYCVKEEMENG